MAGYGFKPEFSPSAPPQPSPSVNYSNNTGIYPSLPQNFPEECRNNLNPATNPVCKICKTEVNNGVKCQGSNCPVVIHSHCFEGISEIVSTSKNFWKCKNCQIEAPKRENVPLTGENPGNNHVLRIDLNSPLKYCVDKLTKTRDGKKSAFANTVNKMKDIVKGYSWIDYTTGNTFPKNAYQGGTDSDGHPVYVGRASYSGDLIPAKLIPGRGEAYVAYNGREHSVQRYQVLCNYNECFKWVAASRGWVPEGAVPGGHTSSGETLYIGRVRHQNSLTIGKVHPSHKVCYISYGGEEISHSNYEVLTV